MDKTKIVLATNNEHKVYEFNKMFENESHEFVSLKVLNFFDEIIENGNTYEENSLIKATAVTSSTPLLVLADDSGLEIASLPNLLGINSARFEEGKTAKEKNEIILKMLENNSNRDAHFTCVLTLMQNNQVLGVFKGVIHGSISNQIQGENGFGYDPIFIPNGYDKTIALLGDEEKNKISHRAVAVALLKDYLYK